MATVRCADCGLRCKPQFRQFTDAELDFVSALKSDQVSLLPDAEIIRPGEHPAAPFTLFAGWAYRYQSFGDGGRQILDILLPGDLIGLQAMLLDDTRYGVKALTAVSLCVLGGRPVDELFARHPALTRSLVRSLMQDQRRTDGQLAFLGRRNAAQRMGFLMLEIFDRLSRLGMANGTWCQFPLQRRHLADALGLSGAHVNRSEAELRDAGLATLGNNVLVLLDRPRLEEFAGYRAMDDGDRFIL